MVPMRTAASVLSGHPAFHKPPDFIYYWAKIVKCNLASRFVGKYSFGKHCVNTRVTVLRRKVQIVSLCTYLLQVVKYVFTYESELYFLHSARNRD
jgi:hypothetical protein